MDSYFSLSHICKELSISNSFLENVVVSNCLLKEGKADIFFFYITDCDILCYSHSLFKGWMKGEAKSRGLQTFLNDCWPIILFFWEKRGIFGQIFSKLNIFTWVKKVFINKGLFFFFKQTRHLFVISQWNLSTLCY